MDDVVSTHLGSTPKASWGDGRRQADVGVSPLRVSEIGPLTEVRCVLK